MLDWHSFRNSSPAIATAAERLLATNEVAFLATVSSTGRPRLHPFVPKLVEAKLVAFIMDSSPKYKDLLDRQQYSIHTLPGEEDEECLVSGCASLCNDDKKLRTAAAHAMGFATGVDSHHILFEFKLDRALWTRWLDFGTPDHRPYRIKWTL
ncbi:MAG: pyridoxamine 5'-phosphate oxidase family protein [Pseudomonadota bacterium]